MSVIFAGMKSFKEMAYEALAVIIAGSILGNALYFLIKYYA